MGTNAAGNKIRLSGKIIALICAFVVIVGASAAYANDDVRQQLGNLAASMGLAPQDEGDADPAAQSEWGSVPKATVEVLADTPTQDAWTKYLNNTRTEYAGNVWTDKSVTADDQTVIAGDASDPIVVYRNSSDGSSANPNVEASQDATFLTDLSALSSSAYVQEKVDVPLDIVLVANVSSSMGGMLQQGTAQVSGIEAMSGSMRQMVSSVKAANEQVSDPELKHRLAIVKFAGDYYGNQADGPASPSYHVGNDFADGQGGSENLTQVVMPLTVIDEESAATANGLLQLGQDGLRANADTVSASAQYAFDKGMTLAKGVLDGQVGLQGEAAASDGRPEAQKVVVLFSDFSTGAVSQAAAAVNIAAEMKAQGVTVYVVGFYEHADNTDVSEDAANVLLNALSSNYPQATADADASTVLGSVTLNDRAEGESHYLSSRDGIVSYPENKGISEAFDAVMNRIVSSSGRLPTMQTGGGSAVTIYDELGAYMEVKDVKGLVYGPGVRSADDLEVQRAAQARLYVPTSTSEVQLANGDTQLSYYFDYEVLPVYTVDAEGFEEKHATPVSLGATGAEDQIRVTVTKHADLALGDIVEVRIPPRLLPLLEYEARYDQSDDGLLHLYRSSARPAHLFYSSGLKSDAVKLIDEGGSQSILPEVMQDKRFRALADYASSHADEDAGIAYFYNNLFDGDTASNARGTTTATFGISETNRYYYFTSDQPLYVMDDSAEGAEGAVSGTVYGDDGAGRHTFVRATLQNAGENGAATDIGGGVTSNVDVSKVWYLPVFGWADELGGVVQFNEAFVRGDMTNMSLTNPQPAVSADDVRADADGLLYLPKGTKENHHRGHLDSVKGASQGAEAAEGDGVQAQPGGATQTAQYVLEGQLGDHMGVEYLGNNGRIAITTTSVAEVSSSIMVDEDSNLALDRNKEFAYALVDVQPPDAGESDSDEEQATPDVYVAVYEGESLVSEGAEKLEVGGTFKLKHGQRALLGGLPAGWHYVVEQAPEAGYDTTAFNDDGSKSDSSLGEEEGAVAASGTTARLNRSSVRFVNEFRGIPFTVVPTSRSQLYDEGVIAASVVLSGNKQLSDVDPFAFSIYAETDFDMQTGAISQAAEPLATGYSDAEADGRVVWTLQDLSDDEGNPVDNPLVLNGATGADGVRFYVVQDGAQRAGITLSTAIYEAEVVAQDANSDGVLEAAVSYDKVTGTGSDSEPEESAEFHNNYAARTHSARNVDGSFAEGALHVDVSETLQGRDLQGRGRLRFILVDSNDELLDAQGAYVLDAEGAHVPYAAGETDFDVLYENAISFNEDASEGTAVVTSFFDGADLASDELPSYWVHEVVDGKHTYTASLHIMQLQRYFDANGNVAYLNDAGVSAVGALEREVVVTLVDSGDGVLSASVDYGKDGDGNAYSAAEFVNAYVPAMVNFGDKYSFLTRVVGRQFLTDRFGDKDEMFQFHVSATGDWGPVSPLPGGMGLNTDKFGVEDQWLYTPLMPSTVSMGGQTMQVGAYLGESAMTFQFMNTPFSQENMVAYEVGSDGIPVRDESGAYVPQLAPDGSPKHVTQRTFTYTVRLVGAEGPGSYGGTKDGLAFDDSTVADVSVTVVDDGAGHLSVSDSYIQVGGTTAGEAATFTNVYSSQARADVPAIETVLHGHDLKADQFSYTVIPVATETVGNVTGATAVEAAVKAGMVDELASEADKLRAVTRGVDVFSGVAESEGTWDDQAQRYEAVTHEDLFDAVVFYNTDLESGQVDEAGYPLYDTAKRYTYQVTANRMPDSTRGYTYDEERTAYVTFTISDDAAGSLSVETSVVKGGSVQTGSDAVVRFANTYDASTNPADRPSFNGAARIDCFTKQLQGTSVAAGELRFTTAVVNRENEVVGDSLATVGRNTRAISDGGTSPIAFYEIDDQGNLTYDEFGIRFTLAELEKLAHDNVGRMVVSRSIVDGRAVYGVRLRAVEEAHAGSTPKRDTLYYMAYFTDNDDGTLSGTTVATSESVFENSHGDEQDLSVVGIVWVNGRSMDEADTFDFRMTPVDGAPMRFSAASTASEQSKDVSSQFIVADGHGRVDFGDLHFRKSDLGGNVADGDSRVFAYEIRQVGDSTAQGARDNASYAGFSFDEHVEHVYVRVTWDEAAQELSAMRVAGPTATTAAASGDFVFENVYRIGSGVTSTLNAGTIAVTKVMTGRELVNNGFAVVLADRGGDGEWSLGTHGALVKTMGGAQGSHAGTFEPSVTFPAKFDELNNTYEHVYSFDLYEALPGDRDGRIYDKSRYRLTATVSDDKLGHLSVDWQAVRTHDADGAPLAADQPAEAVQFNNSYNATGQAHVTTSKRLQGRQLFGDGFTFTLRMAEFVDAKNSVGVVPTVLDDVVAQATNGADGSVELGTLYYSEQDLSSVTAAGYLESLDKAGFDRSACQSLQDLASRGLARAYADEEGRACWDILYVLTESYDRDAIHHVEPATFGYAVNVHVVDNGEGTLVPTVTSYALDEHGAIASSNASTDRQFVNVYEPEPLNVSLTDMLGDSNEGVAVWVTTDGYDQKPGDYVFELIPTRGGQPVATGTNEATASAGIDRVTMSAFTDASQYFTEPTDADGVTFYLRQSPNDSSGTPLASRGITYDSTVYRLRAVVSDKVDANGKPTGELQVKWAVYQNGAWEDRALFANSYHSAPVAVSPTSDANDPALSLSVALQGRAIRGSEFEFELYEARAYNYGRPTDDPVSTGRNHSVMNEAAGETANLRSVQMSALRVPISAQGTTSYKLVQKAGSAGGVDYDATVYDVQASAVDKGDGTLRVSWSVAGTSSTNVVFTNVYAVRASSEPVSLTFTDTLYGRPWKAQEKASYALTATGDDAASAPLPTDGTNAVPNSWVRSVVLSATAPEGATSTPGATAQLNTGSFVVTPAMMAGRTSRTFTYTLAADTVVGRSATTSDKHEVSIVLLARDDGQGGISTELQTEGSLRFVRQYQADSRTYTLLRATKTLEGWALDARANPQHRFEFGITPADYASALKIGAHTTAEQIVTMTNQRASAGSAASVALSYFTDVTFGLADVESLAWDDPSADEPVRSRTYNYTLREVHPSTIPAGYTYSTSVYAVEVKLVDDGEGVLSTTTTVTAEDGTVVSQTTCSPTQQQSGVAAFTNSYSSEGSFSVPAEVKLVGRQIAEDEFRFTLQPVSQKTLTDKQKSDLRNALSDPAYLDGQTLFNGAVRADAKSSIADGYFADIDFESLRFSAADLPKLVEAGYGTLSPVNGVNVYSMFFSATEIDTPALEAGKGVTRSVGSFDFTVRVTDAGTGQLGFELLSGNGEALGKLTFVNVYEPAPAYVSASDDTDAGKVLRFTKRLSGRAYTTSVGTFSFTLEPSQRASYSYAGKGTTPLPVTDRADDASHEQIKVERAASTWVSQGRSSRASIASFGTFKFTKADLSDGLVLGNGHVRKTFEYELREVIPEGTDGVRNGITYDDNARYLQITVEDDMSGQLKVVDTVMTGVDEDTFVNSYDVSVSNSESGSGAMSVQVTLHGAAMEARELSFTVAADEGDTASIALLARSGEELGADGRSIKLANSAAHPDGDPAVMGLFRTIVFDEADLGTTFAFTVSQDGVADAGVTADDTQYRLEITPVDKANTGEITVETVLLRKDGANWTQLAEDEDGKLVAYDLPRNHADWQPTWSGTASSPARPFIPFECRYSAGGSVELSVVHQLVGTSVPSADTGENGVLSGYAYKLKVGDVVVGTGAPGTVSESDGREKDIAEERYVLFDGQASQTVVETGASTRSSLAFVVDTSTEDAIVGGRVNLVSPSIAPHVQHVTHHGDNSGTGGTYDTYRVRLYGYLTAPESMTLSENGAHVDDAKPVISITLDIDNQSGGDRLNVSASYPGDWGKARFRSYYEQNAQRTVGIQGTAQLITNRGASMDDGEFSFTLMPETAGAPMPDGSADGKLTVANAGAYVDFTDIAFKGSDLDSGAKAGTSSDYGDGTTYKDFVYVISAAPTSAQSADNLWKASGNHFARDSKLVYRVVKGSDGALSRERYRVVDASAEDATELELTSGGTVYVKRIADDELSLFEMESVYMLGEVSSSPTDSLTVQKSLVGRPLRAGGFQFVMRGTGSVYGDSFWYGLNGKGVGELDDQGVFQVQLGQTGKDAQGNDIDGQGNLTGDDAAASVKLPAVTFAEPGVYRFELREDMAANPLGQSRSALGAISFSQKHYDLSARVTNDGGTLSVEWQATDPDEGNQSVSSLVFTNTYQSEASDVSFMPISIMRGRAQVERGFTYTASSPAGASWASDSSQTDATTWWKAHNGNGADNARVQLVEDAVGDGDLLSKLTSTTLDAALVSEDEQGELSEEARAYLPTKEVVSITDAGNVTANHDVWCVPLKLTQTFDASAHSGVEPLDGKDPDSGMVVSSEYDVTIVALDDNEGGLTVRVVNGKLTAEEAGDLLKEKGLTTLSGAAADSALGQTKLNVSPLYFIYEYRPAPTAADSVSDLYDVRKHLTGRPLVGGEFDFAMTLSNESNAAYVQVLSGGTWATAPETLHGSMADNGAVSFPELRFLQAGTYTYILREPMASVVPGVSFGGERYRVTVEVSNLDSNGDVIAEGDATVPDGTRPLASTWKVEKLGEGGVATSVVRQKDDADRGDDDVVLFENGYTASTSAAGGQPAALSVTKTLLNRPMAAGWFRFDLTMQTVGFAHDVADVAQMKVAGDEDAAEVVASAFNVAAAAGLSSPVTAAGGAPITLNYTTDQLEAWAEADEPLAYKQVDMQTHHASYTLFYTMSESHGAGMAAGGGVVAKGADSYRFQVRVTDNGNGSLSAEVVDGSIGSASDPSQTLQGTTLAFVNSYEPAASDPVALSFVKRLDGSSRADQTYSFELIPQTVNGVTAPVRIASDEGYEMLDKLVLTDVGVGENSFAPMVFTADDMQGLAFAGANTPRTRVFYYTLHEAHYIDGGDMGKVDLNKNGGYVDQGVRYAADQTVEVRVSDNAEDDSGKLTVSYAKPTMVNVYDVGDEAAVSVPVGSDAGQSGYDAGEGTTLAWMTLDHRDLEAGEFTFELYYADEGVADTDWRSAANKVATGTNEATIIDFVEEGISDKNKVRVKLNPTPSRISFDTVNITSEMRGGARDAYVYFKMAQNVDSTYAGMDEQSGKRVRHGVALDETVYDVRAHVTDDGMGGLNVEWTVKDASAPDVDANWKKQALFHNSYNAFGSANVEVYSQMSGRIMSPGGLWYRLHMSEGIDEAYDPANSSEYDQMSSNSRIVSGTQRTAVLFDPLRLRLSDLQLSMELGTADVDCIPVMDENGHVTSATYVVHMIVSEMNGYTEPSGTVHPWPENVNVVEDVYDVGTVTIDGEARPGVYYTPKDGQQGQRMPTYQVDITAVDDGDGNLVVTTAYPQRYREDATVVDASGKTLNVKKGDSLGWVEFNNAYVPEPVQLSVDGSKDIAGRDMSTYKFGNVSGERYQFEIKQLVTDESGNVSRITPTNWVSGSTGRTPGQATAVAVGDGASGVVSFGSLQYTSADLENASYSGVGGSRRAQFTYEVTEVPRDFNGVTSDPSVRTFTVLLHDNVTSDLRPVVDGTLGVDVTPAVGASGDYEFSFVNTYDSVLADGAPVLPTADGSGVTVRQRMDGDLPLNAGDLSYELTDESGTVVARGLNVADADDGAADGVASVVLAQAGSGLSFAHADLANPDGTYDAQREFTYTLRQIPGSVDRETYDVTEYRLVARLTDNGRGTLNVRWSVADSSSTEALFVNTYAGEPQPGEASATLYATNMLSGRALSDPDSFRFSLRYAQTDASGQPAPVYLAGAGQPIAAVSGPAAADGVRTAAFPLATVNYTEAYLDQLAEEGFAVKREPTAVERAAAAARGEAVKTSYTVSYVACEEDGEGELPAGVTATSSMRPVTVVVTVDSDNVVEIGSVAYDGGATTADFANKYNAARSIAFQATEAMTGRDLTPSDMFSVGLRYADGSEVALLDDEGKPSSAGQFASGDVSGQAADGEASEPVTFAMLRFSSENLKALEDAGHAVLTKQPTADDPSIQYTLSYVVRQSADDPADYVTVDDAAHALSVVVTDPRDASGHLSVSVGVDGGQASDVASSGVAAPAVAFVNSYDPPYFAETSDATAADVQATVELRGRAISADELGAFRYRLTYADGASVIQPRTADAPIGWVSLPGAVAADTASDPFSLGKLHYTTAFLGQLVSAGLATESADGSSYEVGYLAVCDVSALDSLLPDVVAPLDEPCQLGVTVTVTDDGSGLLTTSVAYEPVGSHADFVYAFDAGRDGQGTTSIRATALMSGRALDPEELFFGLDVLGQAEGAGRASAASVLSVAGGVASGFVANPAGAEAGVASAPFSLGTLTFSVPQLERLVERGYASVSADSDGSDVYRVDLVAYQALADDGVTVPAGVTPTVREVAISLLITDSGEGPLEITQQFADGDTVTADFVDAYAVQMLDSPVSVQAQTVLEGRRTINSDEGEFKVRLFYKGTDVPAEGADGAQAQPVAAPITEEDGTSKLKAGEPSAKFEVSKLTYSPEFLRELVQAGYASESASTSAQNAGGMSAQALGSSSYTVDYDICAVDDEGRKLSAGDEVRPGVVARSTSAGASVTVDVRDGAPVAASVSYDDEPIVNRYNPAASNSTPVQAITAVEGSSPSNGDYTVRVRYADADGTPVDSPVPDGASAVSTPGASSSGSETTDVYKVCDLALTADALSQLVSSDVAVKSEAPEDDGVDTYEFMLVVSEDVKGDSLPANVRPVMPAAYAKATVQENLEDGTLSLSLVYLNAAGEPTDEEAALLVNRYAEASDPVEVAGTKELFGNDSGQAGMLAAAEAWLGSPDPLMAASFVRDGEAYSVPGIVSASASAVDQFLTVASEQAVNRPIDEGQFAFELRYLATGDVAQTVSNGPALEDGGNMAPVAFAPLSYGYSSADGAVNLLDLAEAGNASVSTVDGVDTYTIQYEVVEQQPGAGMQPNGQTFGLVVTVVDDPAVNKLVATAQFGDDGIAFVNTYLADRATYALDSTVAVTGDHELAQGEYEFTVAPTGENADKAPLPSGGTEASNDAAGGIHFGNLEFTYDMLDGQPSATFAYVVHQVVRNAAGVDINPGDGTLKVGDVQYPADYTLTVTVSDTGEGYLSYEVEKSGEGSFTVKYPAKEDPVDPDKPVDPEKPADQGGDGGADADGGSNGSNGSAVKADTTRPAAVKTGDSLPIAPIAAVALGAFAIAAWAYGKVRRRAE